MPSVWILGLAGVLSTPDAAMLHQELARLSSGVRVMYVAAHPDDENSELLAYLASARHAQVVYLSLTRGSGGQNRIGSEQGPPLGVLRTQELLAARRVDGAEQLFTRALDFGYSKSAEETLEVWGQDAILEDVVQAIRTFRPHVIITRFPEEGETHGHHLASARLARLAFSAAADASAFPGGLPPWQATRLLHDVPRFMTTAPTEDEIGLTIAGFDSWRGLSYGEVAAHSRSQHRSQGFGTVSRRSETVLRLQPLGGAAADTDLLEGIGGAWRELEGGAALGRALASATDAYEPRHPQRSVPALIEVRRGLTALPQTTLRDELLAELDRLLVSFAALYLDVRAPSAVAYPGAQVELAVEALRRSEVATRLDAVRIEARTAEGAVTVGSASFEADAATLAQGSAATPTLTITLPADAAPSVLPWLATAPESGRYVAEGLDRISPWPDASLIAVFSITLADVPLEVRRAVRYVHADPVLGERAREAEIHPALLLTAERRVAIAAPGGSTSVRLRARGAPGRYEVSLASVTGWRFEPQTASLELDESGHGELSFEASAGDDAISAPLIPRWRAAGADAFRDALEVLDLDYPHVPERAVLVRPRARLVAVGLRSLAGQRWRVGYVEGTGDDVAASLTEAGMEVTTLDVAALSADLSSYDAIVIGARAYNSVPALYDQHAALMAYAEAGGTVIVQYQTVNRLESLRGPIGPVSIRIDRTRVTDESAAVELLAPEHPALTTPNEIGPGDFEGWVQERGLYFAEEWDAGYTPLLRMSDPGEAPAEGALLVAPHGEGHFVYTGLSFFRQLPAGTPGAYRLFENLVALGADRALARADEGGDLAAAEDAPPFGTWNAMYAGVAALLVLVVGLLVWLSRRYG